MRNPNGYGGITKMSGKRRKPYRVRVTDKIVDGKQIYKNIGYYATRKEALTALAAYNENPNIFNASTVTFADVYDLWSARKYGTIGDANARGYIAAYKLCDTLKPMLMRDIKAAHLQNVMDNCGKNYATKQKLKSLMGQISKYCLENDIIDKNYATFVKIEKDDSKPKIHKPFTEKEIKLLWENLDRDDWADTVLIMIYTGLRIGELLSIKSADVHLKERYMRGGSKTEAGKNRSIPIHERIVPLIEKRLDVGTNLLITKDDAAVGYNKYLYDYWQEIMEMFNMEHLPHDCRYTFASKADTVGMNKLCIKRIIGHASQDVTDKVYTHKEIAELIKEVNKLE